MDQPGCSLQMAHEVQKMENFVVAQEMAVTGKTAKKTNVFWSTVPENEQFRNVLMPGVASAGKDVNNVFSKPQKQVQVGVKKSKSDPVVPSSRTKLAPAKNTKILAKPSGKYHEEGHGMSTSLGSSTGNDSRRASLRNLNAEDKKRVANLIKELAKTGEERELALERLQEERVSFEERLAAVQEAQTALRLEKEVLQQKLKQGEVQLKKYEHGMSLLRQQKKQELIMRKQTAGLAQGTQTSPLQRAESVSTSANTSAESALDVNNNVGGSQIPVYSNKLFDLKVVRDSGETGSEKGAHIDARDGSRLQELYLREYKLQLDLQEKQLEIQRQQVLLQKQLNTLLPKLQNINEQQQENGKVQSEQTPPQQILGETQENDQQRKQQPTFSEPSQQRQGSQQQPLNKQLRPGSPTQLHLTQPYNIKNIQKTVSAEHNVTQVEDHPYMLHETENTMQNINPPRQNQHTQSSYQAHDPRGKTQTKATSGPQRDLNNNVSNRSHKYQARPEQIGTMSNHRRYRNSRKGRDMAQLQDRSYYENEQNEFYIDPNSAEVEYQLSGSHNKSLTREIKQQQRKRHRENIDPGDVPVYHTRHNQPDYSDEKYAYNTDINHHVGRNQTDPYVTDDINRQQGHRYVNPNEYIGVRTDRPIVNSPLRDQYRTDQEYMHREHIDPNEYIDARTNINQHQIMNQPIGDHKYMQRENTRYVDQKEYVGTSAVINHHHTVDNHMRDKLGTGHENTHTDHESFQNDHTDRKNIHMDHRFDHPNEYVDARSHVNGKYPGQNRIPKQIHGRYNTQDKNDNYISHGEQMYGGFDRNQHHQDDFGNRASHSVNNRDYDGNADQTDVTLYGKPCMNNPHSENQPYFKPRIHDIPDECHEYDMQYRSQFHPSHLDGGNEMSPRQRNSGRQIGQWSLVSKHAGTYQNDQHLSNGGMRNDQYRERYHQQQTVPHVLTDLRKPLGQHHSPDNPGLLDQYISNHEISRQDKMNVSHHQSRKNDQRTLVSDNHSSPTSLNNVVVERECIPRTFVEKIPEGIERTTCHPDYSLHDPKYPQPSPRIPPRSGENPEQFSTGSPHNLRKSPKGARRIPLESPRIHQKSRRIPEYREGRPVSPPYRGVADARSNYPNSLVEFVEDLEINEELAGDGSRTNAGQNRVFLNSEEEEISVLSDIFFRNM